MFEKISVLVPTRGRVPRLEKMLASYFETTDGTKSELVFRSDHDDSETRSFLFRRQFAGSVVVGPRLDGYRSLPLFFNEMLPHAQGDVLMCGNDDMVFRTPGWADAILVAANVFPDGLFDFGVTTHNETHYPFSTISRKAVDTLGFVFDPRIFWGDMFWRDVMLHFGRAIMLPHIQIDHEWAGDTPDATFLEGEETRRSNWSGAEHAQSVADAVKKLEGLLS